MNFAELRFWGFLSVGLAAILAGRLLGGRLWDGLPAWYDKAGLLALGLFLLLCVGHTTFLIFLAVAVGTYVGLGWILRYHAQQASKYLLLLIPLQLLPLLYYKYADFVGNEVLRLNAEWLRHLVIPVGISFYTFQKVAFVIDTLALKRPLPRFLDYMNFAGFFPQIVAGPIERRSDLLPQMEAFRWRWNRDDVNEGASWIVVGLFLKMCLADNLADYFDAKPTTNPYLIWLANLLFGLRIYCDFAGYSLVALGLARCLGVRLTLNFASPYCSTSIGEFWRRWHITLSQWFRDYLYIPLGGSRTHWWWLNILIVFVVSGIWHGAGWNFLIWGALHGFYLLVNRTLGRRLTLPRTIAWLLTMGGSFFAWLCFYETRDRILWAKIKTVLNPAAYDSIALGEALNYCRNPGGFVMICFLALAALTLLAEWQSIARRDKPFHYLREPGVLAVLVVMTVLLAPAKNNAFIYFAF